jgi:hypothetical protein
MSDSRDTKSHNSQCGSCHLYFDKKFCCECGKSTKNTQLLDDDETRKQFTSMFTNLCVCKGNNINMSISDEMLTMINQSAKLVAFGQVWIIRIESLKWISGKPGLPFWLYTIDKFSVLTKTEYMSKFHPHLKYCSNWEEAGFIMDKTYHEDYDRVGYGNWKNSPVIPRITGKIYLDFISGDGGVPVHQYKSLRSPCYFSHSPKTWGKVHRKNLVTTFAMWHGMKEEDIEEDTDLDLLQY